jgi:hypothetical protein
MLRIAQALNSLGRHAKAVAALVLVAAVALYTVGCNFLGNDKEEFITVGAVLPISNDFSTAGSESLTWGIHSAFGILIAKRAINQDGGVLGKKFDFVILDGRGNQKTALQMYDEHKNNGVVAIIGPPIGAIATMLSEKAKNDGLPFMTQILSPQQIAARSEYYKEYPAMKDLSDTYLINFGYGPPPTASNACECVLMLADAIKLAGGTNKKDVISAINEINQKILLNSKNSKS